MAKEKKDNPMKFSLRILIICSIPFIALFTIVGIHEILFADHACEIEQSDTEPLEQVYFYCEAECLHILNESELIEIKEV